MALIDCGNVTSDVKSISLHSCDSDAKNAVQLIILLYAEV
jgi:hypothetical protein